MREPYATLFEGYEGHWFFRYYLDVDELEPNWVGIGEDPRFGDLSNGEKVLIDFAAAFKNVEIHLDEAHQYRVTLALKKALGL